MTYCGTRSSVFALNSAATPEEENDSYDEEPSLVLGDAVNEQMASLKSKYPTAEADYLAAARARNAAKTNSVSHAASDEAWKNLRDEKKKTGLLQEDAWEASLEEAGNADSQILIPMSDQADSSDDPEEPKLLLF
jgi:hypothetical protein